MSKNCEVMESSFKCVIDRHFDQAPQSLQYLRKPSYSSAYQCLAWKAIQSDRPDIDLAWTYYKSALQLNPGVLLTLDGLKLFVAIQTQKRLTPLGYDRLLCKFYALRRLMLVR
jgi:hypothetical protein